MYISKNIEKKSSRTSCLQAMPQINMKYSDMKRTSGRNGCAAAPKSMSEELSIFVYIFY